MSLALAAHLAARQPPQLDVDEWDQACQRSLISLTPGDEQLRDLGGGCRRQPQGAQARERWPFYAPGLQFLDLIPASPVEVSNDQ